MSFKRALEREVRLFFRKPAWLLLSCAVTALLGLFTWLSCDGIAVVWRLSRCPPFSPPLILLFAMFILMCILYGLLIAVCFSIPNDRTLCLKIAVSYLATLFWCPLALLAGIGFPSATALLLSAIYLFLVSRVLCRLSLLSTVCSLIIGATELYLLYFTVSFTIIN